MYHPKNHAAPGGRMVHLCSLFVSAKGGDHVSHFKCFNCESSKHVFVAFASAECTLKVFYVKVKAISVTDRGGP
jgi:hypothetical protein